MMKQPASSDIPSEMPELLAHEGELEPDMQLPELIGVPFEPLAAAEGALEAQDGSFDACPAQSSPEMFQY